MRPTYARAELKRRGRRVRDFSGKNYRASVVNHLSTGLDSTPQGIRVYIRAPLSPSSISWHRPTGGDARAVGKVTAGLAESNGSLRVDCRAPGSAPEPYACIVYGTTFSPIAVYLYNVQECAQDFFIRGIKP